MFKLIEERNNLVHKERYEKQWSRLKDRVDFVLSELQKTCMDEQDLAQQQYQDWLRGIVNNLQRVRILRTWVQSPPSLKGKEVTDFIPSSVHPKDLDLSFLSKINFKSASGSLDLLHKNASLESKNRKLKKELMDQKLLMLEYRSSTEAKLEEAREALRETKIREEHLLK
jgi:hypothetical protein